jgi:hypothetical protein
MSDVAYDGSFEVSYFELRSAAGRVACSFVLTKDHRASFDEG